MYLDASALAKLYFQEPDSDQLNALLVGRRDLVTSDLAVTEIVSSLCRRHRERAIGFAAVLAAQRAILDHLAAGVFRRAELLPEVHREAERLLISLAGVALRAADALHLALAKATGCASVVTFDRRMAAAAGPAGLDPVPTHGAPPPAPVSRRR